MRQRAAGASFAPIDATADFCKSSCFLAARSCRSSENGGTDSRLCSTPSPANACIDRDFAKGTTCPVGSKKREPSGVFDLTGNVFEYASGGYVAYKGSPDRGGFSNVVNVDEYNLGCPARHGSEGTPPVTAVPTTSGPVRSPS